MKSRRSVLFSLFCLSAVFLSIFSPCFPASASNSGQASRGRRAAQTPSKRASDGGPALFSHAELVELSTCGDNVRPELQSKMDKLLTTPFIGNRARTAPRTPTDPKLGKFLRVVEWNIERGLNFEAVVAALKGPKALAPFIDPQYGRNSKEYKTAVEQAALLNDADVLVLNELDWGLKRTKYRNVPKDLADALGMNYAYAVEFLEIDPVQLGTEEFEGLEDEERRKLKAEIAVDPAKVRALHGTAVLTRFPIQSATVTPFTPAYDWFHEEQKPVSLPEKGKRAGADKVFLEKILREIRRGGRTILRVDLEVPDLPEKTLTVVAPHIENKCKPEGRRKQMNEVLAAVKDIANPVIVAGDINTTLSDGTPTTIKREIMKRVGSKEFWATRGIKYATGVGLVWDVLTGGVNFLKNQHDPTARHVPVVAPNPEEKLFEDMENHRFSDGFAFDFRGDKSRTSDGREGTLANSNQRDTKGFATTFRVERKLGPVGEFKLDWFFVKAYARASRGDEESYRFAPHFGRTMEEINYAVKDRISDHCPISVDLPFNEPRQ